jgi:hypothetical protein
LDRDVEEGDDSEPDGEAGLEVDLAEVESAEGDDEAGSSEIEGGDSEENQEI